MSNWKVTWCRLVHNDIAYGGGGVYWCRRCLCRFPVPWLAVREGRREAKVDAPEAVAKLRPELSASPAA